MTENIKLRSLRSGLLFPAALCAALLVLAMTTQAHAQALKLDRGWQLVADRNAAFKVSDLANTQGWRDVRVGQSWNAQFEDLRDYMGVAWYRINFDAPDLSGGRRALLRFGAVDYFSEVFVNGKQIGKHEGGYTPFTFDITDALKPGANELVVRVVDPPMDEAQNRERFPDMLYNEIPHGKQNWYVQTGGIWQPVWIDVKPKFHIDRVQVTPHNDGEVRVAVYLTSGTGFSAMMNQGLHVTIRNPGGGVEFTQTVRARDNGPHPFSGRVKAPKLWSGDTPTLYSVEVELDGAQEGGWSDTFRDKFGFRQFEAREGKFYLNGSPFYMIAALDQDFLSRHDLHAAIETVRARSDD